MSVLSQVHEQVGQMVMHLDSLRQHNLNVALVVFAGLFGFQVKFGKEAHYWLVGVATSFIMTIFFLLDFKYHVYGHGYQAVLRKVIQMMAEAKPNSKMEFDPYDFQYAATAELSSLSAIVYYSLIAVGALLGAALQFEWIQFSQP